MGVDASFNALLQPGYDGVLSLSVKNNGQNPIEINANMRMCQLVLADVSPQAKSYGDFASKYQHEKGGVVSNIHADQEFLEYLPFKGTESIGDFLKKRLEDKTFDFGSLSDDVKEEIGLGEKEDI